MSSRKSLLSGSLVVALVFLFSLESVVAVSAQARRRTGRRSRTSQRGVTTPARAQNIVAENVAADDSPAQTRAKLNEAIKKNCSLWSRRSKRQMSRLPKNPFDDNSQMRPF